MDDLNVFLEVTLLRKTDVAALIAAPKRFFACMRTNMVEEFALIIHDTTADSSPFNVLEEALVN